MQFPSLNSSYSFYFYIHITINSCFQYICLMIYSSAINLSQIIIIYFEQLMPRKQSGTTPPWRWLLEWLPCTQNLCSYVGEWYARTLMEFQTAYFVFSWGSTGHHKILLTRISDVNLGVRSYSLRVLSFILPWGSLHRALSSKKGAVSYHSYYTQNMTDVPRLPTRLLLPVSLTGFSQQTYGMQGRSGPD